MAKKPAKETEPDADAPSAAGAPRPRKRLVLVGAIAATALAGAGAGYWFLGRGTGDAAGTQPGYRKPVAFLDIREMLINLAPEPNQDRPRFLKFRVSLEVADPEVVAAIQPLLPRVEDTFQVFVRELRATDLEGSAGIYRLREELLRRVNVAVYPAKVDAVLFKEIVVQ